MTGWSVAVGMSTESDETHSLRRLLRAQLSVYAHSEALSKEIVSAVVLMKASQQRGKRECWL